MLLKSLPNFLGKKFICDHSFKKGYWLPLYTPVNFGWALPSKENLPVDTSFTPVFSQDTLPLTCPYSSEKCFHIHVQMFIKAFASNYPICGLDACCFPAIYCSYHSSEMVKIQYLCNCAQLTL
jgi:hypothetical protein